MVIALESYVFAVADVSGESNEHDYLTVQAADLDEAQEKAEQMAKEEYPQWGKVSIECLESESFSADTETRYKITMDDWPMRIHVVGCPIADKISKEHHWEGTFTPNEIAQNAYDCLMHNMSLPQFEGNTFQDLQKTYAKDLIMPCNCTIHQSKVVKELYPATFTRHPGEQQEHWDAESFSGKNWRDASPDAEYQALAKLDPIRDGQYNQGIAHSRVIVNGYEQTYEKYIKPVMAEYPYIRVRMESPMRDDNLIFVLITEQRKVDEKPWPGGTWETIIDRKHTLAFQNSADLFYWYYWMGINRLNSDNDYDEVTEAHSENLIRLIFGKYLNEKYGWFDGADEWEEPYPLPDEVAVGAAESFKGEWTLEPCSHKWKTNEAIIANKGLALYVDIVCENCGDETRGWYSFVRKFSDLDALDPKWAESFAADDDKDYIDSKLEMMMDEALGIKGENYNWSGVTFAEDGAYFDLNAGVGGLYLAHPLRKKIDDFMESCGYPPSPYKEEFPSPYYYFFDNPSKKDAESFSADWGFIRKNEKPYALEEDEEPNLQYIDNLTVWCKENPLYDMFQEEQLWVDDVDVRRNYYTIAFISNYPHPEITPKQAKDLKEYIEKYVMKNKPPHYELSIYLPDGPLEAYLAESFSADEVKIPQEVIMWKIDGKEYTISTENCGGGFNTHCAYVWVKDADYLDVVRDDGRVGEMLSPKGLKEVEMVESWLIKHFNPSEMGYDDETWFFTPNKRFKEWLENRQCEDGEHEWSNDYVRDTEYDDKDETGGVTFGQRCNYCDVERRGSAGGDVHWDMAAESFSAEYDVGDVCPECEVGNLVQYIAGGNLSCPQCGRDYHMRWDAESFGANPKQIHKRRGGSGAYCVCGAQIRRKKLTNGRYISVCGRSGVRIPPGLPSKNAESFSAETIKPMTIGLGLGIVALFLWGRNR